MSDEHGHILYKGDYIFDYQRIFNFFYEEIEYFNLSDYEVIGHRLGVNPFDLFMLKTFIEKNKITHILELGSGTTSKFLDILGVKRKSFALECIYHNDINFEQINVFDSYKVVQSYLVENDVDMILIDCEHSERMAKLISEKFFKEINYKLPFFVHDWFDLEKVTYTEQIYYYNNLFGHYDLYLMTDLPEEEIKKLTSVNNQLSKKFEVPRCSAIITPKKWKI